MKKKLLEMEETILYGINFEIPSFTSYDILNNLVASET